MENIYSIEEILKHCKSTDTLKFNDFCKYDNNILNYNALYDYLDVLIKNSVIVSLSDKEYYKYLYKPRLLSFDLYGDTEYFYIFLILNNITSDKEFDFRKLRVIKKNDLSRILSEIYSYEFHSK